MTELGPVPEPVAQSRRRRGLLVGAVVVLAIAAIPVISTIGDGGDGPGPVVHGDAIAAVRAAVGTTLAAGSYDMDFTMHSTPATDSAPPTCVSVPPAVDDPSSGGRAHGSGIMCPLTPAPRGSSGFASSGHATVDFDPYAMTVTSNTSAGNGITIFVNTTTVWQGSGGAGTPLSAFASTVEGALGQGQGAVAMLGLASKGGYLNLEQEAVASATAAGTGSVDGVSISYYDATLDLTKLADDPTLTDEERITMQNALPLLREGGYTGTTETIGIDGAGFIREITATTKYSDGSSSTRHSILSNFGCAPKVYTPDQAAPPVTTTVPCAPPPSTAATTEPAPTTTTAPATTLPPTTVPPTTTSEPTTSTSVVATTEPPTSTSGP